MDFAIPWIPLNIHEFHWMDRQRFSFLFPVAVTASSERERDALLERPQIGTWFLLQTLFIFWLISIPEWHTNCIIIVYQNVICVEICKSLLTKDRDAEHRHKERKYCSRQRKKITIHYARNICNGSHSPAPSGSPAREADALTRRLNAAASIALVASASLEIRGVRFTCTAPTRWPPLHI